MPADAPGRVSRHAQRRRYRRPRRRRTALRGVRRRGERRRPICRALKSGAAKAVLHGHCHQKAFNTVGAAVTALKLVPGLAVETFESTCCGMAGAFGYEAEHYDMSVRIGELGVLPK